MRYELMEVNKIGSIVTGFEKVFKIKFTPSSVERFFGVGERTEILIDKGSTYLFSGKPIYINKNGDKVDNFMITWLDKKRSNDKYSDL